MISLVKKPNLNELNFKKREIPVYLLYFTFLLLPFSNALTSISIGLLLTSSILYGNISNWKHVYSKNKQTLLPLVIIYLLLSISLSWTEFYNDGVLGLQHRASFLLIPLLLPFYKFKNKNFNIGLSIFSVVVILFAIVITLNSIWNLQLIRQQEYFGVHRSYMSIYAVVASIHLLCERSKENKKIQVLFELGLSLLLIFIYIMISKMGVISILLVYFIFFKAYKKMRTYILFFIIIGSLVIVNSTTDMYLAHRFTMVFKELRRTYRTLNNSEVKEIWHELGSSGHRILLYKSSLDLISNSPVYGYGIGNSTRLIKKQNWKNGYMRLGEMYSLNAHNDFLQLAIEIGVSGSLLLLLLFINLIVGSIRKKRILFSYIFFVFLINMFVESMLVRQAGIIIFSLLVTLFSIVVTFDQKEIVQ